MFVKPWFRNNINFLLFLCDITALHSHLLNYSCFLGSEELGKIIARAGIAIDGAFIINEFKEYRKKSLQPTDLFHRSKQLQATIEALFIKKSGKFLCNFLTINPLCSK